MKTVVIKAGTSSEQSRAARRGAKVLRAGGLVGFATETVYGIAASAADAAAIRRLRKLKSRPTGPFTVHIAAAADAEKYVAEIPPQAKLLIARTWPGPVTVLLPIAKGRAGPALADKRLRERLCSGDIIGLRCPNEPVATAMLAAVDAPIVAPSANLIGQPSPRTAEEVAAALDGRIDLLIDSGPTRYGGDSTIVRFGGDGWEIVRAGAYNERVIKKSMRLSYLFVCTGNTCRSPIAGGLAKKLLGERFGCEVGGLRQLGVHVVSAGIFAGGGGRATPEAVAAARRRGAEIVRHRSRKLTKDLINDADMVFCMTEAHVRAVLQVAPKAAGKVRRLDPNTDVFDPIGGGARIYGLAAEMIENALARALSEIDL